MVVLVSSRNNYALRRFELLIVLAIPSQLYGEFSRYIYDAAEWFLGMFSWSVIGDACLICSASYLPGIGECSGQVMRKWA